MIKQHQVFSRIGAFLLLLIFLSVPMIETLHHQVSLASHHDSHQKSLKNSSEKTLSVAQVKCKLCDLIRNHSQHGFPADQQSIIFNTTCLQQLNWHFILQASSDFVLACANKGPPAFYL